MMSCRRGRLLLANTIYLITNIYFYEGSKYRLNNFVLKFVQVLIMNMQTEYEFTLPKGYLDKDGILHKTGSMRLATAADEILPLSEARVQSNSGYLTIILLARVITKLGTIHVDTRVIENLYTVDLSYLQDFYQRINEMEIPVYHCTCPNCEKIVEVPVNFMEAG